MENRKQSLPDLDRPFTMIAVKGGEFDMGGDSWLNDALPVHRVEVDDYWIGEYPVTQALWAAVMGEGNNSSYFKGRNRPVESVSWETIVREFLPELNKKTGNTRPPGTEYRLPTEAEWEYAARCGRSVGVTDSHPDTYQFLFSGSDVLDEVGWYSDNSHGETKPVGLKLPNRLGLYDMSGNVWEWCADWYGSDYYQKCLDKGIAKNPPGPEKGAYRVFRGSSWFFSARYCRSAYRYTYTPATRHFHVGFRLVLFSLPV